jgi:Rrf2 family protein
MKLITRDTDYAIRALCFIAKDKKGIVSVTSLVKALGIPGPFLRKLLQTLSKKAILISVKGNSGGFALAKKPDKIFLLNLIKIFQGPFILNECNLKKHLCPNTKKCVLRKKIKEIEKYVLKELGGISIGSLLSAK